VKGARGGSSRRGFYVALVAIAVAGAAAIGVASKRGNTTSVVTINPADTVGAKSEGHVLGSAQAPVEIVEFADFECPICATWATVTEPDVRQRLINTGQARLRVFSFQVNSSHANSVSAALGAECAADQGKYWEMHDRLFEGQNDWSAIRTDDPKAVIEGYAKALGLDVAAWNQCFDSRKHVGRVAANSQEAVRRKVGSTPTFIVGDKMLSGSQPYDVIKALVDSARMKAPVAAAAPVADGAKQ
jgi:protein-disulfide isomerase